MKSEESKKLREPEAENQRLKQIVARQALSDRRIQGGGAGKMVSPAMRRRALGRLLDRGVSRRLGCRVVGLSRDTSRRERQDRRPELRQEVLRLPEQNPRYDFRRVHALLGLCVNLKAVHRIWREEGLALTTRKRRRIQVEKKDEPVPPAFGDCWSADFAGEWLENRRLARIVGLQGVASRENLLLKARPSIRSCDLVRELSWLFLVHGKPRKIRFDDGPEVRSNALTSFLQEQGVKAGFLEPGSSWQNGHIESFFGKLRDELLDMEIFPTGKDRHLDDSMDQYNHRRPHSALGGLTPAT